MSLRDLSLKGCYESYEDNLLEDFYNPILAQSIKYKRIAGFFSSSSIALASRGLSGLINNRGSMQLIISPKLSKEDVAVIKEADINPDTYLEEILINQIEQVLLKDQFFALGWLLANKILNMKIVAIVNNGAFLNEEEVNESKLLHQKIGILEDKEGNIVSFSGSVNETASGWVNNLEEFKVFKGWEPSIKETYIDPDIKKFSEIWEGKREYVYVFKPNRLIERLIKICPTDYSWDVIKAKKMMKNLDSNKWNHQLKAMKKFIEEMSGILEMATGTGKTRTCLMIIVELIQSNKIDTIIISVPGNDLCEQWENNLLEYEINNFPILRSYSGFKEHQSFCSRPEKSILVIQQKTPENLLHVLKRLTTEQKQRTLIVFDEVHNMGSISKIKSLSGEIIKIGYRLGLSATPERNNDEAGQLFIEQEIGKVIFSFTLEDAIKKGILCEFDYVKLPYKLTEEEKQAIKKLRIRLEIIRTQGGTLEEEERIKILIAKIRKLAENKLPAFKEYLKNNSVVLDNCIVFAEEMQYAKRIQEIIYKYINEFYPYYDDANPAYLTKFASGEIKTLITCEKINEGIDIKSCKTIVLFSSDRFKKTTIQRIGRCLRTNPEDPLKRGLVIDFCDDDSETDKERSEWISKLAEVKKENE
jgi:DNA or RNA helicases of superfamily II